MVLKEPNLIEGRSTGIPKILRVMRTNASPQPRFESDEERSSFLICLPAHARFDGKAVPEVTSEVTPEVTPEVGRLLAVFQGEMGRAELMKALGLKDEKHFREHYLQTAIGQGVIEMTIPDKPRSRLQKYRLTGKGKAWLRGLHE